MARVAHRQSLLSCGVVEQHSLLEDIINLTREDERETSNFLSAAVVGSVDAKREKSRQMTDSNTHPERGPSIARDGPAQDTKGIQGIDGIHAAALQSPKSPSACPRAATSTTDIRRVDLVGQAVTSMGLADVVDATLGAPRTTCCAVSSTQPNDEVVQDTRRLWVLTIRQCQLSSLLPVAGLLHHLDGLIGLGIHDVAGLALAGVERVLAEARCLNTLTIRRCGLVHLPRLQSGSIEVLDLSDNAIENTSGLETLFRLKELNLAGNRISALADLRPLVPLGTGCLRALSLDRNSLRITPRCGGPRDRTGCSLSCPLIQQRSSVHLVAVKNGKLLRVYCTHVVGCKKILMSKLVQKKIEQLIIFRYLVRVQISTHMPILATFSVQ